MRTKKKKRAWSFHSLFFRDQLSFPDPPFFDIDSGYWRKIDSNKKEENNRITNLLVKSEFKMDFFLWKPISKYKPSSIKVGFIQRIVRLPLPLACQQLGIFCRADRKRPELRESKDTRSTSRRRCSRRPRCPEKLCSL